MFPYFLIASFLGFIFYLWWMRHTWGKGAPYEGMLPSVVERVVRLANVGADDVVYDLGSGDGRVVIAAALRGAKAYGIEIDRLRVLYSRLWIKLLGLGGMAKIIRGDVFKTDLSNATVVCLYLTQEANDRILSKLKRELKKGTRIVSAGFKMKDWKADKYDIKGPPYGPLHLYVI